MIAPPAPFSVPTGRIGALLTRSSMGYVALEEAERASA